MSANLARMEVRPRPEVAVPGRSGPKGRSCGPLADLDAPESPGLYLRLTVTENLQCFAGLYELDDDRVTGWRS